VGDSKSQLNDGSLVEACDTRVALSGVSVHSLRMPTLRMPTLRIHAAVVQCLLSSPVYTFPFVDPNSRACVLSVRGNS
jgi:hypothetical protein